MRYVMPLVLAVASIMSSETAQADLGDQLFKLLADDGVAWDNFGLSVAISGTTAIVGAGSDDNGLNSGSAYLFDVTTGLQIGKLLPNDGEANDGFGVSVAISGTIAIAGAQGDDDNGSLSGSAYVFDITDPNNPVQIAKLLPIGGEENDWFGFDVAISGTTAVVGAHGDDDNGTNSGAAYLFDVMTGTQIAKLLPSDGEARDSFGQSVAISGTPGNQIAIVGSHGDDDFGSFSGSAYLFDAASGAQIAKLLPTDGERDSWFGYSVGVFGSPGNEIAIVGSVRDDDNGDWAGSAYLFNVATGQQINKLLPSDGATDHRFGHSVGISGETAIVGAYLDDDNGFESGSAYFFDISTGQQIAKLLPGDGAADDEFGRSVAISGETTIVGAAWDDDAGNNSGGAYLFSAGGTDTDGDGLLDSWETNGIPYTDGGGTLQHFMLPDADPMHKDLYVEVDAMTGFNLSDAAVTLLEGAFWASPLTNPDNDSGVTLHVLKDETDLPHVAIWQTDGCWPLDFDNWRSNNYGTSAERSNPDSAALLEAKAKAYRYCIVADKAGPKNIGGCGQTPGDNFVIFIGSGYTDDQQAAVFMHELGHNLSLDHGGGDGVNGKPNYPSIMNYVYSYKYAWNDAFWRLDFSREDAGDFVSLDETSLDELAGIGTLAGFYSDVKMPFGVNELDLNGDPVRRVKYVTLDGSATDFGHLAGTMFQDGDFDLGVEQDLNYVVDDLNAPPGVPIDPSFPELLAPYDDWAHVGLPLAAALGDGAPAINYPTDELTTEARDWIDANFPMPPGVCTGDLDGDGDTDQADLGVLLSSYGVDGGGDLDGDGDTDQADLGLLLADYGCAP